MPAAYKEINLSFGGNASIGVCSFWWQYHYGGGAANGGNATDKVKMAYWRAMSFIYSET